MFTNKQLNEMPAKGRESAYQKMAESCSITEINQLSIGHRVKILNLAVLDTERRIFVELTPKGLARERNSDQLVVLDGPKRKPVKFGETAQPLTVGKAIYMLHRYGEKAIQSDFLNVLKESSKTEEFEPVPISTRSRVIAESSQRDQKELLKIQNAEKDAEIEALKALIKADGQKSNAKPKTKEKSSASLIPK